MRRMRAGGWSTGPGAFSVSALRAALCGLIFCLGFGLLAAPASIAHAQQFGTRDLSGKVLGDDDKPLSGAIVYLQNSRNNDIKTFISTADGSYRFADLSSDTDYTLWASLKGKKSPTKTVSSFDSRKHVFLDLHIK